MNKLVLNFTPCSPTPPQGYNIQYRVAGSASAYTNAGNFFITPAIFYDTINPAGTCYEGFISSDCGDISGNAQTWNSCESESGDPVTTIAGTIIFTAHNVNVDIDNVIPCDVTFPIEGIYDDGGTPTDFSTNVTVLAGETSGIQMAVVTGAKVITCIRPTSGTTFVYSVSCLGVIYLFILEIDIPC